MIIFLLVGISYLVTLVLDSSDVFWALLLKAGFSLGGRALSLALGALGCSGFIAEAIAFFIRILLESPPSIGKMVLPAGSAPALASGGSTFFATFIV